MVAHRQVFERFKEDVEEELGDKIEDVVLFGSVARGEENERSDIDILIIARDDVDKKSLKERAIDLAYEKTLESGVYLSVKVFKRKELDRLKTAGSPFMREITAQGEAVHA